MRKGWSSYPHPIRRSVPIADSVIAIRPFSALDTTHRFSWRDYRSPANIQEVSDEGFNILHRVFLDRWRSERVVSLVIAGWHVLQALFDDPQALPHLCHAHHSAIVTITILCDWDFKSKIFVTGVRLLFPEVPFNATCPEIRTCYSPLDGFLCCEDAYADSASLENCVAHHKVVVFAQPLRKIVNEVLYECLPSLWKVLSDTSDPKPVW